jgi:S-DNA-T family DNA segregation ATPase FtsK/SpoIIIE
LPFLHFLAYFALMSTQPKNRRKTTTPQTGARRKTAPSTPVSKPAISDQRKQELMGLVLMVVGFLLSLAIFTYHPADDSYVTDHSLVSLLGSNENPAHNSLGLLGARIAFLLVPSFLGYYSLALTLLLVVTGYLIFRHRSLRVLSWVAVLTFWFTLVLACLAGWYNQTPGDKEGSGLTEWSGAVGGGISNWMYSVFGSTGSLVLLLLFFVVLVLLAVDQDIQKTFDRIEDFGRYLKNRLIAWNIERAERKAEALAAMEDADDFELEPEPAPSPRKRPESVGTATPKARAKEETPQFRQPNPQRAALQMQTPRAERPERAERIERAERVNQEERAERADQADSGVESRRVITYNPPASEAPNPAPNYVPLDPKKSSSLSKTKPAPPKKPILADEYEDLEEDFQQVMGKKQPTPAPKQPELALQVQLPAPEEPVTHVYSRTVIEKTFNIDYELPPLELLDFGDDDDVDIDYEELEENKEILLDKLATYNIQIDAIAAIPGPTVTLYELTPAPGVKISKIKSLEDDLAMVLAARGIRIIAPIPGKAAVGIEIPNRNRELVRIHQILSSPQFLNTDKDLPIAMGKTISGEAYVEDLTKMPHLLIAGATGSGKSVGVNTLIAGLLYHCHPNDLKFVMIDPKKIELQQYSAITDHFIAMPENAENPIITDFTQALGILKSCEKEMELRYDLLAEAGVRGIKDYNRKFKSGKLSLADNHRYLPYIVVIVDELADLMMTAGKDIEAPIARLAQMARAVGIHLVLATQRPSVDVITGLIKANFPARIAFQVASKIDARTILDQNGAEQLVGNGDFLYMNGSRMVRVQGPYISVDEVEELTKFIGAQKGSGHYVLPTVEIEGGGSDEPTDRAAANLDKRDPLFKECAQIIVRSQQGSVSLLQRKLSIGYTRAARIVDQLEHAGIVGPFEGSKARAVLVRDEFQLDEIFRNEDMRD